MFFDVSEIDYCSLVFLNAALFSRVVGTTTDEQEEDDKKRTNTGLGMYYYDRYDRIKNVKMCTKERVCVWGGEETKNKNISKFHI